MCWSHGFSTKTGAELFLLEAAKRENRTFKRGSQRNPKTEARDLQRKYSARLNVRR
jgi:hypothetical protein